MRLAAPASEIEAAIRRLRLVAGLAAVAMLLTGCDGGRAPQHRPPAPSARALTPPAPVTSATAVSSAEPPAVVASACPPSADLGSAAGLPERQGVGRGATLWALFFPTEPTLTTGQELKVVWRMTGSGVFSISATGPAGAVIRPIWGPELHGSSSWNRPGAEWGTGWVFPAAGCWTVTAKRGTASGYIVLRVAAATR